MTPDKPPRPADPPEPCPMNLEDMTKAYLDLLEREQATRHAYEGLCLRLNLPAEDFSRLTPSFWKGRQQRDAEGETSRVEPPPHKPTGGSS